MAGAHPTRLLETLAQDFRYGVRLILKNKTVTFVVVLSLALGIGANAAIFSLINTYLLRSLPVKEAQDLVSIFTNERESPGNLEVSHLNFIDFREQNQVFSDMLAYAPVALSLTGGEQAERINGQIVTGNYFDLLGVRATVGRTFLPEEDKVPGGHPVAVLSHSFWESRYGSDRQVVGKTIRLNRNEFTIIGVASPDFRGTDLGKGPDLWVPMMMYPQVSPGSDRYNTRRVLFLSMIGRLKPGVNIQQAQAAMTNLAGQLEQAYPDDNEGRGVRLIPLLEARMDPDGEGTLYRVSGLLMGIVGIVLLISCANVANLLLARSSARYKEIAIRLAIGASRARLIRQLLTESVLLSLVGGLVGLFLAWIGKDLLWSLSPLGIGAGEVEPEIEGRVLLFTFLISILSGVIFGLVPSLQASKPDIVAALKGEIRKSPRRSLIFGLQKSMVIFQVMLCMVSLVCAGLFLKSLRNAQAVNTGFEKENILMVSFDLGLEGYDKTKGQMFYQQLVENVQRLPGVKSAVIASDRPFGEGFYRTVYAGEQVLANSSAKGTLVRRNVVGPEYFETLGIPLVRGRNFSKTDAMDAPKVVVINEAMADYFWPNVDAVGQKLKLYGDQQYREVVGITKNTNINRLGEEPRPYLFLPLLQDYPAESTLFIHTTSSPRGILTAVRREANLLDSGLPLLNVQTLQDLIEETLSTARTGAMLLGAFGILALLLATIGIYGVVAYSVSQRTREIGMRIALGAQNSHVIKLVLVQGMIPIIAGVVFGVFVSLNLTRLITNLLYGVSALDPATFGVAALALIVVSLLASYLPARKATKIEPLRALRLE